MVLLRGEIIAQPHRGTGDLQARATNASLSYVQGMAYSGGTEHRGLWPAPIHFGPFPATYRANLCSVDNYSTDHRGNIVCRQSDVNGAVRRGLRLFYGLPGGTVGTQTTGEVTRHETRPTRYFLHVSCRRRSRGPKHHTLPHGQSRFAGSSRPTDNAGGTHAAVDARHAPNARRTERTHCSGKSDNARNSARARSTNASRSARNHAGATGACPHGTISVTNHAIWSADDTGNRPHRIPL